MGHRVITVCLTVQGLAVDIDVHVFYNTPDDFDYRFCELDGQPYYLTEPEEEIVYIAVFNYLGGI